jgi:hypothetical protein
MTIRYGVEISGSCRICGRSETITEMHHIISRGRVKKMSEKELHHLLPGVIRSSDTPLSRGLTIDEIRILIIEKLPGNIVELCGGCHDMTKASESYFKRQMARIEKAIPPEEYQGDGRCQGTTMAGRQCRIWDTTDGYCSTHEYQRD